MAQTTRPDVSFGLFLYVAMGWSRFAGVFRRSSRLPVVVEGGMDQGLETRCTPLEPVSLSSFG